MGVGLLRILEILGLLGFRRRDDISQKYQCGHPGYLRRGGKGRGNNF